MLQQQTQLLEQQVQEMLDNEFNGQDMINIACQLIEDLPTETYQKLFLVACNRLGESLNGRQPETPLEGARFLNQAILHVLSSWNDAQRQANAMMSGTGGNA